MLEVLLLLFINFVPLVKHLLPHIYHSNNFLKNFTLLILSEKFIKITDFCDIKFPVLFKSFDFCFPTLILT